MYIVFKRLVRKAEWKESLEHFYSLKWNQDPGPRLYYCFLGCLSLFFASLPFQEYCCCSVTQSCPTLYDITDCNTSGFPVLHHLWELAQTHVESIMPCNHLILCCPLILLPSIFTSIRVFFNELALCIRWPKYWSFSYSISPSNEYSGLISTV